MDISIIIASYNTVNITRRCLNSIFSQTKEIVFEVIVVDNNSIDGSVEMVATEFPEVRLIRNDVNLGFASAQNIGLQIATGRFLLTLNSDVLFVGNPCKTLIDYLSTADINIGVVGPQILNSDGTIAPSARRAIHSKVMIVLGQINRHFNIKRFMPGEVKMRKYLGWLLSRWHDNYSLHDAIRQVDFVDGMFSLFKREALTESGLFDEQFFFDSEIMDLSNRIRKKGWKIIFFPGAQCIHIGHSSRKKLSRIVIETHRSELIYYAKYYPEVVPLIKRWAKAVVIVKLALLRAIMIMGLSGDTSMGLELINIYKDIINICNAFKADAVWQTEKIQQLDDSRMDQNNCRLSLK